MTKLEWVPSNKSGTEWRVAVSYGFLSIKKANNGKCIVETIRLRSGVIMTGFASISEAAAGAQEMAGWYQ